MKAEIISIGSELLIGHVVNTNSAYLSEELNAIGISTLYHVTVGDNAARIQACLKQACSRSDIIICTGGLGPTTDDITHETIADFLGTKLVKDEAQKEIIEAKFNLPKHKIPASNYKQALVFEGAEIISNEVGTAIGSIIKHGEVYIASFPGVPIEMKSMFEKTLKPFLLSLMQEKQQFGVIKSRKIKFINIGESAMAERIGEKLFAQENPSVAPYATLGECYVRITAKARNKGMADLMIRETEREITRTMKDYIYAYDDDTVYSLLQNSLKSKKLSISFAESCTGGLLSKRMTDLPGASDYAKVNLVTYSNESKIKFLGVAPETIEQYGAVSAETALAMVEGLSKISDSDVNVSITGIAGPSGGSPEKPIGTIYVGLSYQGRTDVQQLDWKARSLSRSQVRELATIKTLYRVLKFIED